MVRACRRRLCQVYSGCQHESGIPLNLKALTELGSVVRLKSYSKGVIGPNNHRPLLRRHEPWKRKRMNTGMLMTWSSHTRVFEVNAPRTLTRAVKVNVLARFVREDFPDTRKCKSELPQSESHRPEELLTESSVT